MGPQPIRSQWPRRMVGRVLIAALAMVGASCSSDDTAEPGPVSDIDRGLGIARSVADDAAVRDAEVVDEVLIEPVEQTPAFLDDPALNPEGVINAAVLLHSGGDVDAAFLAGAFSRAELDAARSALADGSLDYLFD